MPALLVSQWRLWNDTPGDVTEYMITAALVCGLGLLLHAYWMMTHDKAVLDAKVYGTQQMV